MNNGLYDGIQDYGGREENITFKASSQSYKISLYYLATFLKSFFFSIDALLSINAMLDFICAGFTDVWGIEMSRTVQNVKNMSPAGF